MVKQDVALHAGGSYRMVGIGLTPGSPRATAQRRRARKRTVAQRRRARTRTRAGARQLKAKDIFG